jgi:hypothetical protein
MPTYALCLMPKGKAMAGGNGKVNNYLKNLLILIPFYKIENV